MLVGLFLISGDQGGFEQKKCKIYFYLEGSVAPWRRGLTRCLWEYHRLSTHASWTRVSREGEDQSPHHWGAV